jgi:hypothetical protein
MPQRQWQQDANFNSDQRRQDNELAHFLAQSMQVREERKEVRRKDSQNENNNFGQWNTFSDSANEAAPKRLKDLFAESSKNISGA